MKIEQDENDFPRAIAHYLAAGMPAKHGLTEHEYIARCRELWDACETDEKYPVKLLIDRLYVDTRTLREFGSAAYVDPRARATTDKEPRPKEHLYCIAIGALPFWSLVGKKDAEPAAVDEPTQAASEFGLYIIAVLDVLGFERMYRRLGPQRMQEIYERLIAAAQSCTETQAVGMHEFDDVLVPTMFHFDLGFAYFSDTLLLWAPLGETHVSPFLARCADVFLEALALGIPLRGAVAAGEAILDQKNGVFLGTPLIDAARLEHAQDWIGVSLTRSCREFLPWLDSSLLLPYTPPCKPETRAELHGGFALDWPRRARARRVDVPAAFETMHPPESHRRYYDHARDFATHSGKHARWNREERVPICIGFMTRTIIRTRLDGEPAPPEFFAMLDSMALNGEEETVAASGFHALAEGVTLPDTIVSLPKEKQAHLRFIQSVIDDAYLDVHEIALAAVEQRMGIAPLTPRHKDSLARPATERNAAWQRCIPFLRAIADGEEVPDVPEDLPEEGRHFLEQAGRSVRGEIVPVDLEALISAVVWARISGAQMSELNLRRLAVLRQMPPWDAVADFLTSIASGNDPDVQLEAFDEGAISTIQVVRKILGWQDAVRRSVPQALRTIAPVDASVLYEVAVRAIHAFQGADDEELRERLARLDVSGSPHDAVARYLRHLLHTRREPPLPGGIGGDAAWYLRLVSSSALEQQAGKALVEYLFSVALEAVTKRRSLSGYELAVFSVVGSASDELEALMRHLLGFISGEPDPDLPPVDETFRQAFEHLSEMRGQAEQGTHLTLANAALACRAGEDRPDLIAHLRETARTLDEKGLIARFLLGLIEQSTLPDVPIELDDDLRHVLLHVGIAAACAPLMLQDLAWAALERRWYGEPLIEDMTTALGALAASGEPFASIARYLTELAQRHLWPSIPTGIPRQTLTLLASARRQASEFSRRVIGIGRTHPATQTAPSDDSLHAQP